MTLTLFVLAVCALLFSVAARLRPCNPDQPPVVWKELGVDALYFVFSALFYGNVSLALMHAGVGAALGARAPAAIRAIEAGYGWLPTLPLAVQALLVLFVTDVLQYWLHRLFHGHALWPFHAIHHSSRHVDWTTTYRIHPAQFVVYSGMVAAIVQTLGFSPMVYVVLGPFNIVMGAFVHANLDWDLGPLRYVVATPVFHRWHHVDDVNVRDKNFAPTFPILDLMFGTFYMPKGERPQVFGAENTPDGFLAQLVWPFREVAGRLRARPAAPGVDAPAA
ncbi:sterol desaturase family protein [Caulobacter sp. KR2-114]|uniref:sterol desaturase family protein n=1 Tax=Caulobacter sp. KR2-114 TaxID=3400912 RepID=UPI003BFAC238